MWFLKAIAWKVLPFCHEESHPIGLRNLTSLMNIQRISAASCSNYSLWLRNKLHSALLSSKLGQVLLLDIINLDRFLHGWWIHIQEELTWGHGAHSLLCLTLTLIPTGGFGPSDCDRLQPSVAAILADKDEGSCIFTSLFRACGRFFFFCCNIDSEAAAVVAGWWSTTMLCRMATSRRTGSRMWRHGLTSRPGRNADAQVCMYGFYGVHLACVFFLEINSCFLGFGSSLWECVWFLIWE